MLDIRTISWVVCLVTATSALASADQRDPIARARALYNDRQFGQAIAAADEAGKTPDREDSAHLIAARALLERYRESAVDEDLVSARERFRQINTGRLGAVGAGAAHR